MSELPVAVRGTNGIFIISALVISQRGRARADDRGDIPVGEWRSTIDPTCFVVLAVLKTLAIRNIFKLNYTLILLVERGSMSPLFLGWRTKATRKDVGF